MILALASSEERLVSDSTKEVHTVASKTRNCINRSLAHVTITMLHQCNDLRKCDRLDDLGPGIV